MMEIEVEASWTHPTVATSPKTARHEARPVSNRWTGPHGTLERTPWGFLDVAGPLLESNSAQAVKRQTRLANNTRGHTVWP